MCKQQEPISLYPFKNIDYNEAIYDDNVYTIDNNIINILNTNIIYDLNIENINISFIEYNEIDSDDCDFSWSLTDLD